MLSSTPAESQSSLIGKRLTGVVTSWYRDRGFGFLDVENIDSNVMLHISQWFGGDEVRVMTQVSFVLGTNSKGYIAKSCNNIRAEPVKSEGGEPNLEEKKMSADVQVHIVETSVHFDASCRLVTEGLKSIGLSLRM